MPDWLEFLVLGVAWAPVLVVLHEAGHAGAGGAACVRAGARAIVGISLWVEPVTALCLAGLFGLAVLMQKTDKRG